MRGVAVVVLVAACGRYHFDPRGDAGDASGDGAGDAGDALTICAPWQLRVTTDPAASNDPVIATTGTDILVAWEDSRDGNQEIYVARVSLDGTKLGDDRRITMDAGASVAPSITAAGNRYALAWVAPTLAGFTMFEANDTTSGSTSIAGADEVALGWTGTEVVAAFNIASNISYAHWTPGMNVTPMPITTSGVAFGPVLAWTGSEVGIAFSDSRDGFDNTWFARLAPSGTALGAQTQLSTADFGATDPAIAWTGSEYGVTWSDYRSGALARLRMTRLPPGGAAIDPERELTDDMYAVGTSSVAWLGNTYAIAWEDSGMVLETRVDAAGTASTHMPVAAGTAPAVAALAGGAVVAWEGTDNEIYVSRVCP